MFNYLLTMAIPSILCGYFLFDLFFSFLLLFVVSALCTNCSCSMIKRKSVKRLGVFFIDKR